MNYKIKKILGKFKQIILKYNIIGNIRMKHEKEKARKKLKINEELTILSVNCIAGEIYSILGKKFCSPTINTTFNRKDFLLFCKYLNEYLNAKLEFNCITKDEVIEMKLSPNGLNTIYIRFPHDNDIKKITDNWEKRKKRINYERMYLITDDIGMSEDEIKEFSKLNYKKIIIFTSKKYGIKNTFQLKKYKNKKSVGKYNVKNLNGLYSFQKQWDFVSWINEQ